MLKTSLSSLLLVSLFIGCGGWPGDPVETEKEKKEKELKYKQGSKENPYIVTKNGVFNSLDGTPTYLQFDLKNTHSKCQLMAYSPSSEFGSYFTLDTNSDVTQNTPNYYHYSISYQNMNNGKYTLIFPKKYQSHKLAIYSPCLDGKDSISFFDLGVTQNFKEYFRLFAFVLDKKQTIKFEGKNNIGNVKLFDSNFKKITYLDNDSNKKLLDKGTYYLLVRGTESSETKAQFKVEVIED